MQVNRRIERLEEVENLNACPASEDCACDEVVCFPYELYIKCANPHPGHPVPCYRDWVSEHLVSEQRTVVKGRCAKCETDLGYLWDMRNLPEDEQPRVEQSSPHRMEDIHYRTRLVRAGLLDFVDWNTLQNFNDAESKYAN